MPAHAADPSLPGVRAVVWRTLRAMPRDARRGLLLVGVAWIAVLALQVWDSLDPGGLRGLAELSSVVLGTAGLVLLALTEILRRAEEPSPSGSLPSFSTAAATPPESLALRQILIALPAFGIAAAALLGAAVAVLVARLWLGTSPVVLAIAAFYVAALVAAARIVTQAARRLYAFGQRESARVARAEAAASLARLTALQAQMQPHFLFNALNTVAALVVTNPRAAETTIENLSGVLRATLERSGESTGVVRHELDFVRAYLEVERERFGERLTVQWDVDPQALEVRLPPFVVQPLVENALRHGIGHRGEGGCVTIAALVAHGRLRLTVADTGDGFPDHPTEGTGLGNLRRRLEVLYGPDASLTVASSRAGTAVTLDMPCELEAAHARPDR